MKHKQIDPRISNEQAAKRQKALISNANKITNGKHNGSKRRQLVCGLGLEERQGDDVLSEPAEAELRTV